MPPILDFQGRITEKRNLTHDVIFISLQLDQDLPFKPGQFVSIKITRNGETKLKSYSILNSPDKKKTIDLCIKLVEGGFASEIFKEAKVGDIFPLKGPFGHFVFDENAPEQDYYFIAAGTGVAPFHSMLQYHLPKLPTKNFTLLFGVRTQHDLFLHEEFKTLQQQYSNCTYTPTLSREQWTGAHGRVQYHLPQEMKGKMPLY